MIDDFKNCLIKSEETEVVYGEENIRLNKLRVILTPIRIKLRAVQVNITPIKFVPKTDFFKVWKAPFCASGIDNIEIDEEILGNSEIEDKYFEGKAKDIRVKSKDENNYCQTNASKPQRPEVLMSSDDPVISELLKQVRELEFGLLQETKNLKADLLKSEEDNKELKMTIIKLDNCLGENEKLKREIVRQKLLMEILKQECNDKVKNIKKESDHAHKINSERIDILHGTIKMLKTEVRKKQELDNLTKMVHQLVENEEEMKILKKMKTQVE